VSVVAFARSDVGGVEVAHRHRRHLRLEAIGRHGDVVAVLRARLHVAVGQRPHDLVELLRRERDGSRFLDGGFTAARQRHLDIGGEQADAVCAVGFDQHVRQDGNRVLALDDLLEELQLTHKVGLPGDEFHVCDDLERGACGRTISIWN
jgi:hypothetical protein